ncbi:MAG: VWA domain-containing protein [Edaphobacter sp.]|uniref:VWA domain-containing protein n=1 Tax=Edaphobacter sp. TaxID=1934404 RepID=UPI0023A538A3|nr:VWA domain-containing protein [Edaphobacter sp.]MDE1177573.1 VWA domain-containing protein [Edaphobacter sp.]
MRRTLIAALLLCIAPAVYGQTADDSTLRVSSRLVEVPALVQSHTEDVVYTLRAEDFQLNDRGVRQQIRLDDTTKQPLSLVVLMQTGGAAVREFDKYRGLETMLEEMLGGAPNQVAIVNFDSQPEAASSFTSDIEQWKDAIDQPDPGNSGAAIRDALKFSLNMLAKQPASHRKVILLISQPQDSGSTTTAEEVARTAGETDTAIYSLTFTPQATRLKGALKEPPHPCRPVTLATGTAGEVNVCGFDFSEPLNMVIDAMRKDVAAEVAKVSGGEAMRFSDKNQLDDTLALIGRHMRNRYMLSFSPSSPTAGFHPIHVSLLNHPEFTVTARKGYWLSSETDGAKDKSTR